MATDAEIRAKGIKFLPLQKYLQNPYEFPVEEETAPVDQGIVNTNAFTNSGDNNYTGGNFNLNDFQKNVNDRQKRLNNPSDTFLGFNTRRDQNLTGADAGEYIGSGITIPQEQTMMGKAQSFLTPQSADQIIAEGYQEPRFQPGILATIMGKLDNYRNLPRADQAFIAQNMGYTGPTVFGENNSGLGKDPFGINTRSAFGNYGEFVDKKAGQLTDTLTKKGGKIFDKYAVDPITGEVLNEEEFSYDPITGQYTGTNAAAIAKANQMNKKNFSKLGYYMDKKKERKQIQGDVLTGQMQRDAEAGKAGKSDSQDKSRAGSLGRRPGSGGTVDRVTEGPGQNVSDVDNQAYDSGGREGFGYGLKDGGRAGYFFGGRARLQGGGMSQGNESNISQSTNMGGGITGDLSTARQTANHDRAMRDNQKPPESLVKNIIDTGSELSYLNNLKNLNVPGIALNFGVNKFRNFLENRKTKEEDKLSYNTNSLPTNNYFAEVQQKDLDASKMRGFKKQDYNSYLDQMNMLNDGTKVTPYEFQGLQDGSITTTGTFTAANGGRAMFKNGGLADLL